MKKILSLLLSFTIIITSFPVSAFAVDGTAVSTHINNYEITIGSEISQELQDENALFDGFLLKQAMGDASFFGTNAREYLNIVEQSVYDKLKDFITQIAFYGGLAETTFIPSDFEGLTYSWPTGTDVMVAFESQVSLYNVWTALVHDCPYELYWFDKNREGASIGVTTHDDGTDVSITQFTVMLPVSMNWRSGPAYTTTVTSDVSKVKLAVENAVYIADKYASKDDFTKFEGFKNEICNLVDYNHDEIIGGKEYINNSSWQMINVFDEDPETKTLSDGYAKAFQYLCDISEIDNSQCYSIKGTVDGEDYMWNIITMEDDKTYLVDIAMTDQEKGQYGQYFFAGYDDGGRWSGFVVNGRRYAYHSNNNLFDIELLILADKDYFYQPKGTLYSGQCGDNAYWHLNENGTLTIQGWGDMWNEYTASNTNSQTPPWYDYVENIKNIVVMPGITSIANYRFYMCQYAQTATIPDTVTYVGEMAFYSCMELQELIVPDSVVSMGTAAFGNLKAAKKIKLPNNITDIPDWAFAYCYSIDELVIPDGVTSIGEYAFYSCNNLKNVTMPATVKSVCKHAFYSYPEYEIDEVYFAGNETDWKNILFGEYNENITTAYIHFNYDKDSVFTIVTGENRLGKINADKTTAMYGETVTITVIPVAGYQCARIFVNDTEIAGNSFIVHGNSLITAEFIPVDEKVIAYGTCGDNLTWTLTDAYILTIGGTGDMTDYDSYNALPWLEYAHEIKELVIEDGATKIGKYAFYNLKSLQEVTIPNTVTTINDYAFMGCTSLGKIEIPDSVKSIGANTFSSCTSLKKIIIPDGVTSIGMYTFQNCISLEEVVLPNSVNSIFWRAFSGCKSLKTIEFPKHSIHISGYAFENCTSLETVHIYAESGNASYIDEFAFYGCSGIKSAKLEGVRYVGKGAFKNCTGLENVIINADGVTENIVQLSKICQSTFDGCKNLKTIYIPIEINTIENSAFRNCTNLENVCYQGTKQQWQKINVGQNNEDLNRKETFFEAGKDGLTVPVYRLYHMQTAEHFYTRSASERDAMVEDGWIYEGHAFYSPLSTGQAVYRLKNPTSGYHHYPYDEDEIEFMISDGWIYEGFAFYSAKGLSGAIPIYRLYNLNILTGIHHFTASEKEKSILLAEGWRSEGVAWYGFSSSAKPNIPDSPVTPEQPEVSPSPDPVVPENPDGSNEYTYAVPSYRFENVVTGEQFFTVHRSEKEVLSNTYGWKYTGVDFYLPGDGGQKVYRMMNPNTYYHHYTASQKEIESLKSQGWVYEGFAFYSAKDMRQALPVHRLFNLNARYGTHAYTVDENVKEKLINEGWRYENAGWYALAKP